MKVEKDDFDDALVALDTYNSDLNLVIDPSRFSGHPLTNAGFAFMWAGARATYGITKGKICFEVKVVKHMDCPHLPPDEPNPFVVRVGFSAEIASMQLGEEPLSYGYGGTGKMSTNCQFKDYGQEFMEGDTVTAFLNMDTDLVQIGYAKNGKFQGWAYKINKNTLKGQPLFSHVLSKNCEFEVNFGQKEQPYFNLPDGFQDYTFIGCIPLDQRVRGVKAPARREDCEMIMMCGLPGAGKSVWAAAYSEKNPDKKYNVLGTNNIIDKMKVMGLPRKRNYAGRWEVLIQMATKCINKMFEIGSKLRRNYILDQTNVYPTAQRRKMRNFEGFKRKAVVVVPTDLEFQKRINKREREEGKDVPDSAVLEMKANFKLPEVGDIFDEVVFTELQREEAEKLVRAYNEEGRASVGPPHKRFHAGKDQSPARPPMQSRQSGGFGGSPGRNQWGDSPNAPSPNRGGYGSGGDFRGQGGNRGGRGGPQGNFGGRGGDFGSRGGSGRGGGRGGDRGRNEFGGRDFGGGRDEFAGGRGEFGGRDFSGGRDEFGGRDFAGGRDQFAAGGRGDFGGRDYGGGRGDFAGGRGEYGGRDFGGGRNEFSSGRGDFGGRGEFGGRGDYEGRGMAPGNFRDSAGYGSAGGANDYNRGAGFGDYPDSADAKPVVGDSGLGGYKGRQSDRFGAAPDTDRDVKPFDDKIWNSGGYSGSNAPGSNDGSRGGDFGRRGARGGTQGGYSRRGSGAGSQGSFGDRGGSQGGYGGRGGGSSSYVKDEASSYGGGSGSFGGGYGKDNVQGRYDKDQSGYRSGYMSGDTDNAYKSASSGNQGGYGGYSSRDSQSYGGSAGQGGFDGDQQGSRGGYGGGGYSTSDRSFSGGRNGRGGAQSNDRNTSEKKPWAQDSAQQPAVGSGTQADQRSTYGSYSSANTPSSGTGATTGYGSYGDQEQSYSQNSQQQWKGVASSYSQQSTEQTSPYGYQQAQATPAAQQAQAPQVWGGQYYQQPQQAQYYNEYYGFPPAAQ